jgi:hypothetical protein
MWSIMPKVKKIPLIVFVYSLAAWLIVMAAMIYISMRMTGPTNTMLQDKSWIGAMSVVLIMIILTYILWANEDKFRGAGH